MVPMRSTAAALAALALLAACESDPKPEFEGDPTPSAPVTSEVVEASPSTTPTSSMVSPEATVRAWVDARNAALQDGDVSGVRALSTNACSSCKDSFGPIAEVYANGGSFDTPGWKVVAAKEKEESATSAEVSVALRYEAGTTVSAAGAAPVSYDVEKHIAVFKLVQASGGWRVEFIGYLS